MSANQAPVGGIVSKVNGQFYEGGQFTPDTGLFCGRGSNKVKLTEKLGWETEISAKIGQTVKITWYEARTVVSMRENVRLQAGYEIATEDGTVIRRGYTKRQVSNFAKWGF